MAYTGLYNADGQIILNLVNGSTYTGLYSPDGNWNAVLNTSSTYVGKFHPCGALNAVVVDYSYAPRYNANGSINVVSNNFGGYSPTSPSGLQVPPVGQQFLTVTDLNNNEQNLTVTDINGAEQPLTVATGLT